MEIGIPYFTIFSIPVENDTSFMMELNCWTQRCSIYNRRKIYWNYEKTYSEKINSQAEEVAKA